ncbi:hypothetical protein [Pantoea sp. 18069]|uniref:hypothetical protein n=1 Tax=Pantoea sp. 18069 TaxID=2681415 RepID=UPI00135A5766|nr:hypothetical protein [Pantoea sp. 18069]
MKTWQFLLELGFGENRSALEYSLVHKAVKAIQASCVPAVFTLFPALSPLENGMRQGGAHHLRSTCTQMRQIRGLRRRGGAAETKTPACRPAFLHW